jgi:hypothetical protein
MSTDTQVLLDNAQTTLVGTMQTSIFESTSITVKTVGVIDFMFDEMTNLKP